MENTDRVNHPSYYTWLKELCGIEVIDITRHMNFNLGNVIKYVLRSGHKSEEGMSDEEKKIEDLKKAVFYLNDEINILENGILSYSGDDKCSLNAIKITKDGRMSVADDGTSISKCQIYNFRIQKK